MRKKTFEVLKTTELKNNLNTSFVFHVFWFCSGSLEQKARSTAFFPQVLAFQRHAQRLIALQIYKKKSYEITTGFLHTHTNTN